MANHLLTGLLLGLAISAAGICALIVAGSGGGIGWLLVAASIPLLFGYRCFAFAGAANVACLLVGVFGPLIAAAVVVASSAGLWPGLAVLGATVAAAAGAPAAVPSEARPHSPLVRGVRAVSEHVVTAAVLVAPLVLLRVPQMVYHRTLL